MNMINALEKAKRQERIIERKNIKEKIAFIYMNARIINEKASINELEKFFVSTGGIKSFELYGLENNTPSYVDAVEIIFKICNYINASNRSDEEKECLRNILRFYMKHFPIENQAELRRLNDTVSFDKEQVKSIKKRKF